MADDGEYITIAGVRQICGIDSDEISDDDVSAMIQLIEKKTQRMYNTVFTPKEVIEVRDGNGTGRLVLKNNPVLSVRDLYINGVQEDTANLYVKRGSGKIELSTESTASQFLLGTNKVSVKYVYGFVEEGDTSTTISSATTAGTSVSLTVGSISGFSSGDWVEIYGMDGYREAAHISSAPSGSTIVVDKLVYTHESGSVVAKLEVHETMKELMQIVVGITMVARIVGQSYDENTGYSLGELQVQKGEPYTQWRETATQLIRERDRIMEAIKPRPCIM
jgi:hypothetical protein